MNAIEWWLPEEQRSKRTYVKGVKEFLTSMEIGESKEILPPLQPESVKGMATKLRRDFGCRFTIERRRIVTRLE